MANTPDTQEILSWIVPLIGHRFDLEDLPYWLAEQDIQVAPHDDGYALVIPFDVIGDDFALLRKFAESQLDLINGIGRLLNPNFRPVSLANNILGVDSSGNVVSTVVTVGTAEERSKAGNVGVVIGGVAQADPREGAASPLLKAAKLSPQANDALIISGRPSLTWSELYLLFELVESDVGSQMFEFGWITRTAVKLFTHTANSYSALGHHGRHGKDKGIPPSQPMKHDEATKHIRDLVLAWLQHIGTNNDEPNTG